MPRRSVCLRRQVPAVFREPSPSAAVEVPAVVPIEMAWTLPEGDDPLYGLSGGPLICVQGAKQSSARLVLSRAQYSTGSSSAPPLTSGATQV